MQDELLVYPPPLFLYQVTPTSVPHSEPGAPSVADLMFFVSNAVGHDVEVDQIVFDLRLGPGPGDLTTSDRLAPRPVVGPDWSASDDGGGRVRIAPRGEAAFRGLRAGESLGVAVPGVAVNSVPGVANLIVWEASDELRQSYVSVVKSPPGLAITAFQASPVQLDPAHPESVLSWATTAADQVTLSYDGTTEQVGKTGHKSVQPSTTTLYTITATGGGRSFHEQLTVYVPQVALSSFAADPPLIEGGQSSVLRWSLINATRAVILASGDEPDPGPVAVPRGELAVSPRQPATSYTLSATGFGNTVGGLAQVDLLPAIEHFSITPAQAPLDRGLPLSLQWKVRDAGSVSISGLPTPQPAEGSAIVRPNQSASYTLGAKRLAAPRTVQAHLTGQITSLQASAVGATLNWVGAGASSARLEINETSWYTVPVVGGRYVGPGGSRLNMLSTKAAWTNYVKVVLFSGGTATVSAASDYGLNAIGATVTLDWSFPIAPGNRILVRNGLVEHVWTSGTGPQTFVVRPSLNDIIWQLFAPGMTWTVFAGEGSSALDDES